jgi:hypothetical protein
LRHKVAFLFVAIAFPHHPGGGFSVLHGSSEGIWCWFTGSLGGEAHGLGVFKISDFVINGLVDLTSGNFSKSHGEA